MDLVDGQRSTPAPRGHLAWLTVAALVAAASAIFLFQGRWLMALGMAGLSALSCAWYLAPRRRLAFAIAAIALSTAGTLAFVAGIDLYLHHRFAQTGGYNIWGYRGPVVGRKQPGERRIEMLGGSVAFGYGVNADQTIPAYLERQINLQLGPESPPSVTVVNLGWNSEGAHSFTYTLKDYEYLRSDIAVLYSGYNDLAHDTQVFRHQSAVFRLTGYLPILPIIPLSQWLRIENLSDTATGKVVFRPGLAEKTATEAADTALRISQALEQQLGKLSPSDVTELPLRKAYGDWTYYVRAVRDAVAVALAQGKQVFVITEPFISDMHVDQQTALVEMLRTDYGKEPRVHYVNAGKAVDLEDRTLCYDGMHLTAAGNRRVAEAIAPSLVKVLR
jgi:lysophospholipase L1-like esterase